VLSRKQEEKEAPNDDRRTSAFEEGCVVIPLSSGAFTHNPDELESRKRAAAQGSNTRHFLTPEHTQRAG
jgi:hypothetical protein